ncbi:MAG: hypothetical protein MI922_21775 [Bacteroidales bacterium]|nr:hypothetical protein [Bacteroidales bacterium]
MKKSNVIFIWFCILLVTINSGWLVYNLVQLMDVGNWLKQPEHKAQLVFIGLLLLFFTHIVVFTSILGNLKVFKQNYIYYLGIIVLGVISFFKLFMHWGCLTDIVKEFPQGLEIRAELSGVYISAFIHFMFLIGVMVFYIVVLRSLKLKVKQSSIIAEQLFNTMNFIGLLSSVFGFASILAFASRGIVNVDKYRWIVWPITVSALIPYITVFVGWIINAIKYKNSAWYDEKQKIDMQRSGMLTVLIGVLAMIAVYAYNYNNLHGMIHYLWLPVFIFITMLVFSFSNLVLYNKR